MTKVEKTVDVITVFKEIEKELQEGKGKKKEEISELEQEIDTAKINEQQAKQVMLNAKKGEDPKEYAKAVAEHRTTIDIVEFYSGKLEKLKNESFIKNAEYRGYTNRIKSELEKMNNEAERKARELLTELSVIAPGIIENINKGDELLGKIDKTFYISLKNKTVYSSSSSNLDKSYHELYSKLANINDSYGARTILNEGKNK